jgi:hypothetical protein
VKSTVALLFVLVVALACGLVTVGWEVIFLEQEHLALQQSVLRVQQAVMTDQAAVSLILERLNPPPSSGARLHMPVAESAICMVCSSCGGTGWRAFVEGRDGITPQGQLPGTSLFCETDMHCPACRGRGWVK